MLLFTAPLRECWKTFAVPEGFRPLPLRAKRAMNELNPNSAIPVTHLHQTIPPRAKGPDAPATRGPDDTSTRKGTRRYLHAQRDQTLPLLADQTLPLLEEGHREREVRI